jgi:flagellar protein FlgJ
MDIGALGSYLKDTQLLPLGNKSAGGEIFPSPKGAAFSGDAESFSRLFDRLRDSQLLDEQSQAQSRDTAALDSKKPVIDKTGKLYEQCLELETFLVKTLIKGMRNTVQKANLIDTGFAGEMYEDMLYDEYTKDFTKNANFGLAETAYLELTGQRGKLLVSNPSGNAES